MKPTKKKKTRSKSTKQCLFCNTTKGLERRVATWGGYWHCPEKNSQDCLCRRRARIFKIRRSAHEAEKAQAKQLAGIAAMEALEQKKKAKAKL